MATPVMLHKNQVILTDKGVIVAVYPYRDSDTTKITLATKRVHIVACGVPGVEREKVRSAYELAVAHLQEYASGTR
jgi:DNA/RNA-binding domain of Phe-tRNA-synthetase-like protein